MDFILKGYKYWTEATNVKIKNHEYCQIDSLFDILEKPQQIIKELFELRQKGYFRRNQIKCSSVVLKKTAFRTSLNPGSDISIDFGEALVFSVFNNDENEVFKSESIRAIIEYKYNQIYGIGVILFLEKLLFCVLILNGDDKGHIRKATVILIWAIIKSLMLLPQIIYSTKTPFVWLGFIWPITDLLVIIFVINFSLNSFFETPCDTSFCNGNDSDCQKIIGRRLDPD